MPANKFSDNMAKPDGVYRESYMKIITNGIQNNAQLTAALSYIDDASTGLRQAAAAGDAVNLLGIPHAIRFLARVIDKYRGTNSPSATLSQYLLKKSSNGKSALDWAINPAHAVEARGEYGLCAAILLGFGFSERDLQADHKNEKYSLYPFIQSFKEYQKAHQHLNFEKAYETPGNPEDTARRVMSFQSMHYLTAHYFMMSHEKSLLNYVDALKKDNIQSINVFEIGCATPFELIALVDFFASKGIQINYKGFDIDAVAIGAAKKLYQGVVLPGGSKVSFELRSGNTLHESDDYKGKGHLVIMRHPDITHQQTGPHFAAMLTSTVPQLLNPTGLLLMSCYWESEVAIINEILKVPAMMTTESKSDFVLHPGGALMKSVKEAGAVGTDRPYQADHFAIALKAEELTPKQKLKETNTI